ncbi:hypothetical protein D9M70_233430 [compost metagenome]
MVGDIVRGLRVGADDLDRHDAHAPLRIALRGVALVLGFRRGSMAIGAVLLEQRAASAGLLEIEATQQVFRPGRWFQLLEGFFQGVQVVRAHAGRVALGFRHGLAVLVEQLQRGADAEGFADVAGHRLHGRTVPLHPVEFPDVPQVRIAHRGIGHPVVAGVDGIAEHAVGDAAERIGAAEAFLGGVEVAMPVVVGGGHQAVEYGLEVTAQLAAFVGVAFAKDLSGETVELHRIVVSEGHAHPQRLTETAAAQRGHGGGQRMQGGAAVDANGFALVTQLAGVAGGAGDVQVMLAGVEIGMPSEADRQVARVQLGGLLSGIDKKTEAGEVVGAGQSVAGEGQFQGDEPVVTQAFNLRALRRVVVGLPGLAAPLVKIAQLARLRVSRQVGVGDVVERHGQHCQDDGAQNQQPRAAERAHDTLPCCVLVWRNVMPFGHGSWQQDMGPRA